VYPKHNSPLTKIEAGFFVTKIYTIGLTTTGRAIYFADGDESPIGLPLAYVNPAMESECEKLIQTINNQTIAK
jgi:sugar (pentulose or hexulose) kinase